MVWRLREIFRTLFLQATRYARAMKTIEIRQLFRGDSFVSCVVLRATNFLTWFPSLSRWNSLTWNVNSTDLVALSTQAPKNETKRICHRKKKHDAMRGKLFKQTESSGKGFAHSPRRMFLLKFFFFLSEASWKINKLNFNFKPLGAPLAGLLFGAEICSNTFAELDPI